MLPISRRTLMTSSAASLLLAQSNRLFAESKAPAHQVDSIHTISLQADRYHGWPTLTKTRDGELLVVCSGGRDSHICPMGRVELIRSRDNGKTWSFARTILDGPLDDRDAGIVETAKGTLLVSTFTSLAYQPTFEKALAMAEAGKSYGIQGAQLDRWKAAHSRVADGTHASHLGCWMIRSEDKGLNWSAAYRVPVNSPHGPVLLRSGRLLYVGVALWEPGRKVAAYASDDDGATWQWLSDIPTRSGDEGSKYHELHAVEAADGRLIVQIRNHNSTDNRETLQTHSIDGGKTWAEPKAIGVWGLPTHLLRMSDDRLLMTYGHRRKPLGNQARISDDNGQTWSEPILIQADASSGDLGYPSTVEIAPGSFVTVWYEVVQGNSNAQLQMASWRLT